jgi:hypothetical protein
VVNSVVRGELPAGVLGTAVRAARGPGAIRPGAAFTATIKRCESAAVRRAGRECPGAGRDHPVEAKSGAAS